MQLFSIREILKNADGVSTDTKLVKTQLRTEPIQPRTLTLTAKNTSVRPGTNDRRKALG